MNRTGLLIALGIAAATVIVFSAFPQLDLALANLFYDPKTHRFPMSSVGSAEFARRAAMWISWAFAAPAIIALVVKLIWPGKPLLVGGRMMMFFLVTIVLTAGLLSNALFKQHWGRPRPVMTTEFSGPYAFKPFWDSSGSCPKNCSFFSGESTTAFWTFAPASLAPAPVRPFAYAAVIAFGTATSLLRMSFGGHYASDVIVGGVVAFLVVWLMYNIIYRWAGSRMTDEAIDQALGRAIMASRERLARWFTRLRGLVRRTAP